MFVSVSIAWIKDESASQVAENRSGNFDVTDEPQLDQKLNMAHLETFK